MPVVFIGDHGEEMKIELLSAVLRVEYDHVTLRDAEGWLLWSQKITSEATLQQIIDVAKLSINYKQGT